MFERVSPRDFSNTVHAGSKKLESFRNARLHFLKEYVGQYYDREQADIGDHPLNMIFNAIAALVPNIVMSRPKHRVHTEYLAYRQYAELLGLALSWHDTQLKIDKTYRRAIVDAIFTLGILKTGLADSDSIYVIDGEEIDNGTIYSDVVDFDNWVVDPSAREHMFADAKFMGDRICASRINLLESGLYDNTLVEKLPSVEHQGDRKRRAEFLSDRGGRNTSDDFLEEQVEIIELWVPDQNVIVTIPGSEGISVNRYLRVDDYYGPDSGPYTLLALTQPVPGNPMPVPSVGIWYDLHILANRMASKIVDQAMRQKSVLGYRPASADDAQEILDADDGEAVSVQDTDGMAVLDFGGQRQSNEAHLAALQVWFNEMAGNPNALQGIQMDADSATEASILANQATVRLDDMKGMVYDFAAEEGRKRAWFLHTDPMIQLPLTRRMRIPPTYQQTPMGPMMATPARTQEVQVFLTPEARRGDFLDFTFNIEPESMTRKDSRVRFQEAMDFAVKILPAAINAAQTAAMMGLPFDVARFIIRMAEDRGIDWMGDVFYSEDFQLMLMQQQMLGPQASASKGQPHQPNAGVLQNGQPGQVMSNPGPATRERQRQQEGANQFQSIVQSMLGGT